MKKWAGLTAALMRDESGATAIEYALIAAIVSMSIIAGLRNVGIELDQIFIDVAAGFSV
jgi:pilus assembly protein Flp/PilA